MLYPLSYRRISGPPVSPQAGQAKAASPLPAVDMIVDRRKMREEIARLLALLQNQPAETLA